MNQKLGVALSLSIGMHFILIGILFLGDFTTPLKPTPIAAPMEPIQAVAIDRRKVEEYFNKIKKKKEDEKRRVKELEQKKAAAKKKRAKEEKRIKDLERQRKKEIQDKKAAEKIRNKKVAEKKKADEAKRLKEQAKAKKADDLRKKKAAERKRKEQQAKERAEQEKMLEQQMAEEMSSRQQARRQQMMSEIDRFTALITQLIQSNLLTDRSTMEGKSCKLTISLAPSGFVTNVVSGQGNKVVCDAAEKAIYNAGTLPVSKDPEVFKEMRTISLTVVPEF